MSGASAAVFYCIWLLAKRVPYNASVPRSITCQARHRYTGDRMRLISGAIDWASAGRRGASPCPTLVRRHVNRRERKDLPRIDADSGIARRASASSAQSGKSVVAFAFFAPILTVAKMYRDFASFTISLRETARIKRRTHSEATGMTVLPCRFRQSVKPSRTVVFLPLLTLWGSLLSDILLRVELRLPVRSKRTVARWTNGSRA